MPEDPKIPTLAQLRDEAESLENAAKAYMDRARQIRAAIAAIEAIRSEPLIDSRSLTTEVTYATDNGMTSSSLSTGPSRGPVPDGDGPATKIMRELGFLNLAELAKALGERHGTVRSWNMRAGGLPERVLPAVQKLRATRPRKTRGK